MLNLRQVWAGASPSLGGNLPALRDASPRERERTSTYSDSVARRRMRQRGDTILDTLLFGLGQALKDAFDVPFAA